MTVHWPFNLHQHTKPCTCGGCIWCGATRCGRQDRVATPIRQCSLGGSPNHLLLLLPIEPANGKHLLNGRIAHFKYESENEEDKVTYFGVQSISRTSPQKTPNAV